MRTFPEYAVPESAMPKSILPKLPPPVSPPKRDFAASAADESPDVPPAAEVREGPAEPRIPTTFRKEVSAMFFRLIASFARSDDVHQARLDQCWNSQHRYLMGHSTWSVK